VVRIFDPFVPSGEAMAELIRHLCVGFLCTSDESRGIERVVDSVASSFPHMKVPADAEWFSIKNRPGRLCGLFGFHHIIDGWKCVSTIKLWDTSAWGLEFAREGRDLIGDVMSRHGLIRVRTSTADPRVARMAEMGGFKREGVLRNEFKFDGKLYDTVLLAREREV
jgi:RimJ/RimL family protein N-acetyltransferase